MTLSYKSSLFAIATFFFIAVNCFATDTNIKSTDYLIGIKLKRILVADTEEKVNALEVPQNSGHLVLMDTPILNNSDFAALVTPFLEQQITPKMLNEIILRIKKYINLRGVSLVNVYIPHQSILQGNLRVVVVTGRYSLSKLYLTSIEKCTQPYSVSLKEGQILLDDLDSSLASPELASALRSYFGKPITPDSVNKLILDLSNFLETNGKYLAEAQLPDQSTVGGLLRIGLKLGRFPIKKLVIADTVKNATEFKITSNSGIINILNSPVYNTKEFYSFISPYIGKPITIGTLLKLKNDLTTYGKTHDRPLIESYNPIIDFLKGEVRIGVTVGHFKQLHLKGNRWFNDDLIIKRLGIKPGEEITLSELDAAFNWANQNSFRQVQVNLDTFGKNPGEADLDVQIQETDPYRLTTSYSNALNSPLGSSSYSASIQAGNLWGLDQEMSYQFSTNNTPKYDQSHSLDYKIPLPWHDIIRLDAAYSLVEPRSLFGYAGLNEIAKNIIGDITYVKSIQHGFWTWGFSEGIDYKQINTNLTFGEFTQPITTYDTAQIVTTINVVKKDRLGSWSAGLTFNFSPGNINSRDTQNVYGLNQTSGAQTGKSARYEYGRLFAERDILLPYGLQWVSRGQLQLSSTNLQGSEQITIGGGATVRGYSENESGDQGWIINQELRSPFWKTSLPFIQRRQSRTINTQVLGFLDYGFVSYKHVLPSDINLQPLMGTGLGIRTNITGHFSLAFDLGWRLRAPLNVGDKPMRGSFSLSLSY